jgi:hypothetical protein
MVREVFSFKSPWQFRVNSNQIGVVVRNLDRELSRKRDMVS